MVELLADGWVIMQFEDDKKWWFTCGSLGEAPKLVFKSRVDWLWSSDGSVTETASGSSVLSGSHVLSEGDKGMGVQVYTPQLICIKCRVVAVVVKVRVM